MALAAEDIVAECQLTTTEKGKAERSGSTGQNIEEELDRPESIAKEKGSEDPKPKVKRKRKKRSRKNTFKGSKERCRLKNKELAHLVKKCKEENEVLNEKNTALIKRSLMLQRKCSLLVKSSTAPRCGTGVSSGRPVASTADYDITGFRHLSKLDIDIDKSNVLGRGTFGKCFLARLGHREVCAKVFRNEPVYTATFPIETALLGKCCHENLPWLYGVYSDGRLKVIVMSLHMYQGTPTTVHKLLCDAGCAVPFNFDISIWNKLLLGILRGVQYLHNLGILHNDIKGDNVLVQNSVLGTSSILTDLGKGCYLRNAKSYSLSREKKLEYARYHPQIAPDLVDGHCKQSKYSDIYSIGRILREVNKKILKNPDIEKYSSLCLSYLCTERPTTTENIIHYLKEKLS